MYLKILSRSVCLINSCFIKNTHFASDVPLTQNKEAVNYILYYKLTVYHTTIVSHGRELVPLKVSSCFVFLSITSANLTLNLDFSNAVLSANIQYIIKMT